MAEEEATVEDFLSMIKAPKSGVATHRCVLIRKIDNAGIPNNMRKALDQALVDENVSNVDILAFLKGSTKANVNLTNIQDHRRKDGCIVCLYGGATK